MSLLAILAGAGLVFGLGADRIRTAERQAAEEIAGKLEGNDRRVALTTRFNGPFGALVGDVERATITASRFHTSSLPLFVEPWRSKQGRIGVLRLDLKDFALGPLAIRSLEAQIPGCRYDFAAAMRGTFRLSRSGEGLGEVKIEEAALARFILAKFKEIRSVDVRCDRGYVWVEGEGTFFVIDTRFRVLGRLSPRTPRELVLTQTRVALDGLPVEPAVAKALLDTMDPVIHLDRDLGLHGAMDVTEVDARDGVLTAKGRCRIPTAPGHPGTGPPSGDARNLAKKPANGEHPSHRIRLGWRIL